MPEGKTLLRFKHIFMQKKKTRKQKDSSFVPMPVVNPHAAGIDVGDTLHAVAVPKDRDELPVRNFGTMSCDIDEIALWLEKCGIETIAMESTGVYWKPLFNYLIRRGFEVYLVNARHVRNVTGRKSDQGDAEWLQQLHSFGLLKSSYLPDDQQESLRTLVRYRKTLTEESSRFVLRMQKALELMNVKLHTVIRDLMGKTGTAIIEAIIAGERDAANFVPFIDGRIKADHQSIVKSLQGSWREEQLFILRECYGCYKFFQERIVACDKQIELQLQQYAAVSNDGEMPLIESGRPKKKNKWTLNLNTPLFLKSVLGVDVLAIYGMSEVSALTILAETGTDMGKWANEKHFVSWLNLCPNNKISGGKLISWRFRSILTTHSDDSGSSPILGVVF